ncbi:MAG: heme ABC transporter ATP-binding protein [Acidobacteriota bacterium]|nr:MAG: heme ABC transporter ATP-binding protein [Acidobacteriota bacterium]
MAISGEHLGARAGSAELLNGISLNVGSGEVLSVIGPNGAGKTTLLKILAGERRRSAGKLRIGGRHIEDWERSEISKVRAVLPQNSSLSFPFKVREVAMLGRGPHIRFSETRRDREIVGLALEKVGIGRLSERCFTTLSGGERQRTQLARVLAQIWERPENGERFLLLDEPTEGLDISHQHTVLETARELASEGTAVVAVLHDLNLAAQYCDKILVLKEGKQVALGSPKEVLRTGTIRDVYGIEAHISAHPKLRDIPLVVPIGAAGSNGSGRAVSAGAR